MSTSLFSLIFAGIFGVGTFAGTFQQNLSHAKKPEIDRLFYEIEKDIRKFSEENPISDSDKDYIKNPAPVSDSVSRKRRDINKNQKSKNTLNVWTDLWVGLISNYVKFLWQKCGQKFTEKISEDKKQKAIENAEKVVKNEKDEFENKLNSKKQEIESIYQKMKGFVLKIEIPKEYKYSNIGNLDCPYENYVKKIV